MDAMGPMIWLSDLFHTVDYRNHPGAGITEASVDVLFVLDFKGNPTAPIQVPVAMCPLLMSRRE